MTLPLPDGPLVGDVEPDDWPASLEQAIRDELAQLWHDLYEARRQASNGVWSIGCEIVAYRIVALSRLVGATPWGEVQVDVLLDGLYERLHREAGIEYEPIDWDRVRHVRALNLGAP